jgi:hypothetical protein
MWDFIFDSRIGLVRETRTGAIRRRGLWLRFVEIRSGASGAECSAAYRAEDLGQSQRRIRWKVTEGSDGGAVGFAAAHIRSLRQ